MTAPVSLEASLPYPVFWRGEPILVRVQLMTEVGAAPVHVPVPFDVFAPGVTVVVYPPEGPEVTLAAPAAAVGQSSPLKGGDLRESNLALDRVYAFAPGTYEVRIEWAPAGMPTLSDTVSFAVVEPAAMTLAIAGIDGAESPELRAVGSVSGAGLGALLELLFRPAIDDDSSYTCAATVKRYVGRDPVGPATAVQVLQASGDWCAGRDAAGVLARVGFEMQGAGRHDWAADAPHVVAPAIESEDGLRVFTVTRDGQLGVLHFALPLTEVEPASGPDDWDDEVLVPGPVTASDLGSLGESVLGARALAHGDQVHIALVARGALLQRTLSGGSLGDGRRVELDARVLSTEPATRLDEHGAVLAAVVVAREAERLDALEVGLALVHFGASASVEYRWLGVLESIPVSASVAFAPDGEGQLAPLGAVLDTEHVLHVGAWSGSFTLVAAPAALLTPLTITAALGAPHVAVSTAEGPRLLRL